jgi:muramoyltetrapeptide carboxypeptidase
VLVPPPVRPGDRIRIVAPSGPFDKALVWRGLGFLRQRYRIELDRGMFERQGFLAGSDERRLAELETALGDPEARAVVAARGGYGLTRIAHRVSPELLTARPKWLVGFSDFTALHVESLRAGVASMHAHNVAGLGRADDETHREWISALEGPGTPRTFEQLAVWQPGSARGPLVGGNLTVLMACAAANRLRLPQGSILFLEDVGEAPYRLDRALSALHVGGHLDAVSGIVFGEFVDCPAGRHGVTADVALRERAMALGVPVLAGLPVGHGRHNAPLVLGATASLDARSGRLQVGLDRG